MAELRRVSRLLKVRLAGLVFAWMAVLSVVAWVVVANRRAALEAGERNAAAFAGMVEQQVARTVQATYLTLGAVADAYQLRPHPAKNNSEFRQMMSRRLKDVPFVRALFVIDADGWIIHDTDFPKTPRVSLADRPYFRSYRIEPGRGQAVWPPLLSRSGTGWFLPVTRPLGSAAGFEGIVVAALQAAHFEEQFRVVRLPQAYLVSLLHGDGTLVASYPRLREKVGTNYARLPLFARLREKEMSATFWTNDGLLPGRRVVSYRAVEAVPFVVRVSRSKDDILAEWRRMAAAVAFAIAVLTVFLGWFIVRLAGDSTRRARDRERRAQAEKLEALGQLSSGMAHDFANLLNVVGMNAELLRTSARDPSAAEQALSTIERSVRSGRHIAERLLAFARRKPLELTRARLDACLEAARPLLAQAAGPRVTFVVDIGSSLPEVLCDTDELDVALLNLVVNARDAMARSGRVSVRAYVCDEESGVPKAFVSKPVRFVCLTVKDDGPGMPEEVRRRALEPFYTTKGQAGTGLGLSQVYGFMRQIGGEVSIDSTPGQGTSVHLFFPVAPARES